MIAPGPTTLLSAILAKSLMIVKGPCHDTMEVSQVSRQYEI